MPKKGKGKGTRRGKDRENDTDTSDKSHGELSDKMKRLLADVEDDSEPQPEPTNHSGSSAKKQDTTSDVDSEQYNGSDPDEEANDTQTVRCARLDTEPITM